MANYLSMEKRNSIFHLLCEGNGIRSIQRIIGCSTNTISELQNRYCHIIEYLNKTMLCELKIDEIEADEIRTYVARKDNIRWVYIAMDRKSRVILHFHIGKRDAIDAKVFLSGLSRKLDGRSQVATDCLKSYVTAVNKTPYGRIDSNVSEISLLRAGHLAKSLGRTITNRIETHNGVVRQHVSRLIRKTRCFSKKEEGLRKHLTLFFFYYNFIKRSKAVKCPPAVAAGLTDESNWQEKLIEFDLLFSENMANKDARLYGITDIQGKIDSFGDQQKQKFLVAMGEISPTTIGKKTRDETILVAV